MTKNHIFIKSVALGVLFTLSPFAKADGGVDRVLVTYFDKLYKSQTPKCTINEVTKTRILSEIEPKCLVRTTLNNEPFISGVKSECTEASVKTSVDAQVDALCVNTAQKAEQATMLKAQQQAAAAKQQQAAAAGKSSGEGAQTLQAINQSMPAMIQMAQLSQGNKKTTSTNNGSENSSSGGSSNSKGATNAAPTSTTPANTNMASAVKSPSQPPMSYSSTDGGHVEVTDISDGQFKVQKFDSAGAKVGDPTTVTKPEDLPAKFSEMKVDPNDQGKVKLDPKFQEAADQAPGADGKAAAAKAVDGDTKTGMDKLLDDRKNLAAAENKKLEAQITNIRTQLNQAKTVAPKEATENCNANEATRSVATPNTANPALATECIAGEPKVAITCLETNVQALEALYEKLKAQKESCSTSSAEAEKACSMVRSEKAQQVQQIMSIGATVLSKVTAASEACGTTSTISKIAQGGMLVAQGACSAMKLRCDMSCGSAKSTLEAMKAKAEAIQQCPLMLQAIMVNGQKAKAAAAQLVLPIEKELAPAGKDGSAPSVQASVDQCKAHSLDVATMGVAALGFLSAFQDAETCKEQLAAGRTNGGGSSTSGLAGPSMTTAEYCAQPQNAASITCKCTANPNADGCMGSLAKSGVALGKINANGGASGFASAKQNGLSSVDPVKKSGGESSEPPPGAGLSEAAREALGINSASSGGSPGVTGNFGSASENAKATKEEKEKPKFGFFSSIGSMLSGGKSANQAAKAAIRNYEQDQAIKRKLASEQLRAEITTASGKSNFDKIRSRYRENASSFEQ